MQDGSQSIPVGSTPQQPNIIMSEIPLPQQTNFAVEYQTPEAPQPETVEVEGEQIPLSEVDNPKSYKHFQSKFTKEQEEKNKILQEKIRLEERLRLMEEQRQAQPKGQEPAPIQTPTKPIRPVKPQGYSRLDATTDENSPSAKYDTAYQEYLEQKDIYDEWDKGQLTQKIQSYEQEKQKIAQQEQLAQVKADQLRRFQEAGIPAEKASKIYDWVSGELMKQDNPRWYEQLFDIAHNTPTPQAQRTVQQFEERGQRQQQPLPPGVVSSESAPINKATFGDDLLQYTKLNRI